MSSVRRGLPSSARVAVVGAGAMGAGIAQIAAVAGHPVWLHDARTGAAETAIAGIRSTLAEKGRISADVFQSALAGLHLASALSELKDSALAVEAIRSDERRHTNTCYFTMVAMDDDRNPAAVPLLELATDEERDRHAAAERRRDQRKANAARSSAQF